MVGQYNLLKQNAEMFSPSVYTPKLLSYRKTHCYIMSKHYEIHIFWSMALESWTLYVIHENIVLRWLFTIY